MNVFDSWGWGFCTVCYRDVQTEERNWGTVLAPHRTSGGGGMDCAGVGEPPAPHPEPEYQAWEIQDAGDA